MCIVCSGRDGAASASAGTGSLYVFRIDGSVMSSRWRRGRRPRRSMQSSSVYSQGQKGLSSCTRPATAVEAQPLEPTAAQQPDTLFLGEMQYSSSVQKDKYRILDHRPDVVPRRAVSACLQSMTPYEGRPEGLPSESSAAVLASERREGGGAVVRQLRRCLPIKDPLAEEPKTSAASNASSPCGPREFQIRCTTI